MPCSPGVLVVGVGPVGLQAAAELTRHQSPVRVIDKRAAPGQRSRAIVVHARSLDLVARTGAAGELLGTGVAARGTEVHAGSKRPYRVPLDGVGAMYPFGLIVPQTETERVPFRRAVGNWVFKVTVNYRASPIVFGRRRPHERTVVAASDHCSVLGDDTLHEKLSRAWGLGRTSVTVARGHAKRIVIVRPDLGASAGSGHQSVVTDFFTVLARLLG